MITPATLLKIQFCSIEGGRSLSRNDTYYDVTGLDLHRWLNVVKENSCHKAEKTMLSSG